MIGTHETPRLAIGHATLESNDVPATVELLSKIDARIKRPSSPGSSQRICRCSNTARI